MHLLNPRLGFPRLLCVLALLLLPAVASPALASEKDEPVPLTEYLSLGAKIKRLTNSHTSYEFGNPFPPYQRPLSRLEFPLDSWWGGLELRFAVPRFSVGGEVLTNALGDVNGRFKDSDWDNDENPGQKSIYSESSCRMEPSYMARLDADLEVSDWLGLPAWLSVRPVVGFRYQNFHMVTHDGMQYTSDGSPPQALPGDGIRFKQQYWQYFVGIRSNMDAGRYIGISNLKFSLQLDWAYVEGSNEDNHLLRAGNRFTYENTYGYAWHGSAGLKKGLTQRLFLGVEVEYLYITTTGNHLLVNEPFGQYFGFSYGVRAWSEQTSVSMTLEYRF